MFTCLYDATAAQNEAPHRSPLSITLRSESQPSEACSFKIRVHFRRIWCNIRRVGVKRFFFLFGCAIVASLVWAEQPDSGYVLAGTVVNSSTGEPVARALVELRSFPNPATARVGAPAQPTSLGTFSDAAGTFRFSGLSSANYRISVRKPEFLEVRDDTNSQQFFALDKSREDVRLRLSPLGVIEGKVVDQDGQPVRGVNIVAVTRPVQDGKRVSKFSRSVSTDDRGIYRLWNLAPAKYYVKAAGRTSVTSLYIGGLGPNIGVSEGFAPVYFGGAHSVETAQAVTLEPGSQAQADLRITMEPAFSIHGTLTNFVTDKTVAFELFSGDEEVSSGRTSLDGSTGRFEIHDVIPGAYTLRATQLGKSRGELPVSVSDGDVNGLALILSGSVDLKIAVAAGASAKPVRVRGDDGSDFELPTPQPGCQGTLSPIDLRSALTYHANPPGDAIFHDVLPGQYRLAIHCYGGYVGSVTSGSADLLANPTLRIQGGVAPAPIEVSLKEGGGILTVTVALDHPPEQMWVLLAPQSNASAGPQLQTVQGGGKFPSRFMNLVPGDYTVYAFSTDEVEFRDPQFLQSLSGGASVKIEGDGEKQVTITSVVR
jgi:hypothetical protein